jgi:hypothetical protein
VEVALDFPSSLDERLFWSSNFNALSCSGIFTNHPFPYLRRAMIDATFLAGDLRLGTSLLFDLEVVVTPPTPATFQFHHRIALRGKL